jgi:hypothetical protein
MQGQKLFSSGLVLGLVTVVCFPAHAELLKNFRTDGSFETRSFSIDNEVDRNSSADDYRGETNTRLMVGGNFDLLDDVHARVMLDRTPRHRGTSPATGTSSIATVEADTFLDNAYIKIDKMIRRVDLTIGRQFYNNPNDLNIYFGPQNDELLTVTSADLFRIDTNILGFARLQAIAGKLVDSAGANISGAPTRGTNTDTDVWGAELGTDKIIPLGSLAVTWYERSSKAVINTQPNRLKVATVRAGGDIIMGFGYDAEFLQNFGRNGQAVGTPANDGNAYFLNLHVGHAYDGRPVRAHVEYGRGTSRFAAIAPGRRFGLIWGEHSNFGPSSANGRTGAGLSNLKVFDGGVGINVIPKLGLNVNAYRFLYDAAVAGNTSAGTEYDLIVSWKHSENVSFEVNAATFQVGDAMTHTGTGTNPITRLGADVRIKF